MFPGRHWPLVPSMPVVDKGEERFLIDNSSRSNAQRRSGQAAPNTRALQVLEEILPLVAKFPLEILLGLTRPDLVSYPKHGIAPSDTLLEPTWIGLTTTAKNG